MWFLIFFISLYVLCSCYIAARINWGLGLKGKTATIVWVFVAVMTVSGFVGQFFARSVESPLFIPIAMIAPVWLGIFATAVTLLLFNDVLLLLNFTLKIRKFKFYSTVATICLIIIFCLWGVFNVLPSQLKVRKVTLNYPDLHAERFTITLLTDVHITRFTRPRHVAHIIEKTNALNSDIIIIAGDFIDIKPEPLYHKLGFTSLYAPYGIFAVVGNHEYYISFENFMFTMERYGVRVLLNESVEVYGIINLAGVDDIQAPRFGMPGPDVQKALSNINPNLPTVMISHQPEVFDEAAGQIFLMLSGHTHAGQMLPGVFIRKLFFRYFYGLYYKYGSHLYVSSGTRWWGPPMRHFTRNEIVQIIIER